MNWIASVTALLVWAVVFLAGCLALYNSVAYWMEKRESRKEELYARRFGKCIISCSHWFSENRPAMHALRRIGEAFQEKGQYWRVEDVRRYWRMDLENDEIKEREGAHE